MSEPVGYLDRWSAGPGECVEVRLSAARPCRATLDLVRLGVGGQHAEPDGIAFEAVADVPAHRVDLVPQPVDAGSYAEFTGLSALATARGSLAMLVQPWTTAGAAQTVVALDGPQTSLRLTVEQQAGFVLRSGSRRVTTARPARLKGWVAVLLSWDETQAMLRIVETAGGRVVSAQMTLDAEMRIDTMTLAGAPLPDGSVGEHFDGRLERPRLWPWPVEIDTARAALLNGAGLPVDAVAGWDFVPGADDAVVADLGPHGLHGRLVQGPKRAVRGAHWDGTQFDWRRAPEQYEAVHFHRDDLADAGWALTATVTLPATLRSGAYAVRVRCDDADAEALDTQCRLPLFVRPPQAPANAPVEAPVDAVAVVFPTFTYLAYGNDRCALMGNNPEVLAARAIALEPTEVLLSRHPEWGLSLYDTHHDGSGVSLSSRARPIPTFHPDQRAWQAGEGSGRWNYPGDLLLVEWLERERIAWHAFTDEDLHAGGADVLSSYRVVLTGNHPEYATPQLVAAYRGFLDRGGRMMYLGGNGFYWKIACDPRRPGIVELRRAEDGNRSWAEEPAEYYHAFDGEYGGLWRRNGRSPQSWLGVGYAGQGFRRSVGYLRCDEADDPRAAFVFDGVAQRTFGLDGVIGGGCAGVEVDRFDEALGSDPSALRLARSLPFDDTYLIANEELLVSRPTISAPYAPALRADVVLHPAPRGGAVFATGSIAWIGGLAHEGGDAAVRRITRNVLNRFRDPAPFDWDR
ncbi:MAG: N,N-dimethylformamidase beta subunit family domain-containing protein [Lautropia sp.]